MIQEPSPCAVVVDVESVRRRVQTDRPLPERGVPTVASISAGLRAHGIDPVDLTFVAGEVPLPGADPAGVAERIDPVVGSVLDGIVASEGRRARFLGAFIDTWVGADGGLRFGEVGVDGLVVAAALRYGSAISQGHLAADGIVLVSHDPDVWIAHRYPHGVPVVYAGAFTAEERTDVETHGGSVIDLGEDLEGLVSSGSVTERRSVTLKRTDAALRERAEGRYAAMRGPGTVAVVDVYDVFRHGLAALGSARMPLPDTVRAVAEKLRFPDPTAVYAAIPDIPDAYLPQDDANGRGWHRRDEQFAETAHAYAHDGDPATQASIGELLVSEDRPARERRVSTAVIADAFWALVTDPDASVAVFSDRWDVVALQWHLRSLEVESPHRLVRVGTQALTLEDGPDRHVLLTDELLAALVDAPRPWGRTRRVELARVDVEGPPRRWRIVDLEPESESAVLVPVETERRIEALHPADVADRVGAELELDRIGLRIGDPTTVVPRLTTTDDWPQTTRAVVVGRSEPTRVLVDLDGDGLADGEVITGRDLAALPSGTRVRLARTADGLCYIGPETDGEDGQIPDDGADIEVGHVVEVDPTVRCRREDGEIVEVAVLPGVTLDVGDVILTADVGGRWIALSTHLEHLER